MDSQKELNMLIKSNVSNLKKLPLNKRTRQNLNTLLEKEQAAFDRFMQNHTAIPEESHNIRYLTQVEEVEATHDEFLKIYERFMEELREDTQTEDNSLEMQQLDLNDEHRERTLATDDMPPQDLQSLQRRIVPPLNNESNRNEKSEPLSEIQNHASGTIRKKPSTVPETLPAHLPHANINYMRELSKPRAINIPHHSRTPSHVPYETETRELSRAFGNKPSSFQEELPTRSEILLDSNFHPTQYRQHLAGGRYYGAQEALSARSEILLDSNFHPTQYRQHLAGGRYYGAQEALSARSEMLLDSNYHPNQRQHSTGGMYGGLQEALPARAEVLLESNSHPSQYRQHPAGGRYYGTQETLARSEMLPDSNYHPTQHPARGTYHVPQWPRVNQSGLRLPETTIKAFNGEAKEYPKFKRMMLRILENSQLNDEDRFTILTNNVSGDAYRTIEYLDVNPSNYHHAWQLLDEMFLNQRILVEEIFTPHLEGKFKIKSDSKENILNTLSAYKSLMTNINSLGLTKEDIVMHLVMLPGLSTTLRAKFEDRHGSATNIPSYQLLCRFLQQEYVVASNRKASDHKQSTRIFLTNNAVEESQKAARCFICQQLGHSLLACPMFIRSNNKPQLLIQHRLCIYCGRHPYSQDGCKSRDKLKCALCSENHITELHPPSTNKYPCNICQTDSHRLLECPTFLEHQDKPTLLITYKLCIFCGKHKYSKSGCKSKEKLKCDICQEQHLTLLHPPNKDHNFCTVSKQQGNAVLPTAMVPLVHNNEEFKVRSLIDSGAEKSYIHQAIVKQLKLKTIPLHTVFRGLNNIQDEATEAAIIHLNLNGRTLTTVQAIVAKVIVPKSPQQRSERITEVSVENLADPDYNTPAFVGMLLGVDINKDLYFSGGVTIVTEGGLFLLPSNLGYLVSGLSTRKELQEHVSTFVTITDQNTKALEDAELNKLIRTMYELPEDDPDSGKQSQNEYAEELFVREESGRYVVPIPWQQVAPALGSSYQKCLSFLYSQEKKERANPKLRKADYEFMKTYEEMGHMTEVPAEDRMREDGLTNYIPRIPILKEDSITTKYRGVFHASCETSNGISLNDTIIEGDPLQTDVRHILTRARSWKFVYSADIKMMFRQIKVLPEDAKRTRILWRKDPQGPVKEYYLNTVTGPDFLYDELLLDDNIEFPTQSCFLSTEVEEESPPENSYYDKDQLNKCNTLDEAIQLTLKLDDSPTTSANLKNNQAEKYSEAMRDLIKGHQAQEMGPLLAKLKNGKPAPKGHWTAKFKPFLDEKGIVRLGGRLVNALSLSEDQKHPVAINHGKLADLIINDAHLSNMHANPRLMLQLINEKFWIPRVKSKVYKHVQRCVTCCTIKAATPKPIMGDLPSCRVNPSLPWTHTGMDLAGPMEVKASRLKYDRHIKIWVVVFTCMFTKATHLEIVWSLTTDDLANAISRFLARRGPCQEFWSDNGSNFVGMAATLKEAYKKALKGCSDDMEKREIKWKFIPRWTPHMGGLWESRVKLLKTFLKRVPATTKFTPDQLETVLCDIELLLNSRPLYSLPEDADTLALTPMHLLLSKPAETLPQQMNNVRGPLTKRYFDMKKVQLDMWKELQTFYFTELQRRAKWIKPTRNLEIGEVVVIKDPTRPPADWLLGRIIRTHPDAAGTVRVVDLTTSSGDEILGQAVVQLVPLPKENEGNDIQGSPSMDTQKNAPKSTSADADPLSPQKATTSNSQSKNTDSKSRKATGRR